MGRFATYVLRDSDWQEVDSLRTADQRAAMIVDIFDSDYATVCYAPTGMGAGTAYLGCTPSDYFGKSNSSPPTNAAVEAAAIAQWWGIRNSNATASDIDLVRKELVTLIAFDGQTTIHFSPFVEATVIKFVNALALPPIVDLGTEEFA